MNQDKIICNFFLGLSFDSNGRSIQDILNFNEYELENTHDFIQWVFPTNEKSRYNSNAPIISKNFKDLFLKNKTAQFNFCKTCQHFLNFLGLECLKPSSAIFVNKSRITFIDKPKHNLLRITRVLNSLNQIGKEDCSKMIFFQLEKARIDFPDKIPIESFIAWESTQLKQIKE